MDRRRPAVAADGGQLAGDGEAVSRVRGFAAPNPRIPSGSVNL
jgi:hypothetical protein